MAADALSAVLDDSGLSFFTGDSNPANSGNVSASGSSGTANNNSLIAALAGDAASVGKAFIAADAAKAGVKATAKSPNAIYLVGGAVAIAIIIAVVLLKK